MSEGASSKEIFEVPPNLHGVKSQKSVKLVVPPLTRTPYYQKINKLQLTIYNFSNWQHH